MPLQYENQDMVKQLNRDRSLSKVRGYPSDAEYMDTVGKAALEKSHNANLEAGYKAAGAAFGYGAAKKALASQGSNLHTHEMHIRHADNGGYIVKHDLKDKNGNPPSDGQRSTMETQHPDADSLHQAIDQHMQQDAQGQPTSPDDSDDQE